MSEILINWLKTFPYLTEKVNTTNIEELFYNGFYFGKIFNSSKLFQEMKFLKNTNEKKDIMNNYLFLRKPFRKIGIDLFGEDINDLITKKYHKAELYLFKIKQYLLLDKIQFKEIVGKMEAENLSKLKDEMVIKNKNKKLLNRYNSATRRSESMTKEKKQYRLQSAKLPNINLNTKKIKKINLNNKDIFIEENEKIEMKQMQEVINDINIFENIHMNKKGKIINKRNPWDEINYISDGNDLFSKDKSKKEKKYSILNILDKENKKEKGKENIKNKIKNEEDKINKIKSTLSNYNQFITDNKKKILKKEDLEKGLSLMGLTSTNVFPSLIKIKGNKIPSELIMKSINDKGKNSFIEDKINKTTAYYYNKEKTKDKEDKIKPPASAKKIFGTYKIKKNIFKKKNKVKFSRAQTAKSPKQKIIIDKNKSNIKETDKSIKLLKINDRSQDSKENKNIKDIKTKLQRGLSKIEENEFVQSQNSIPSSLISNMKMEEDDINTKYKKENDINQIKQKILTEEEIMKLMEKKRKEYAIDTINMKNIISSIIDITEIYYEYQNKNNSELIDLNIWNNISYNFIHNINIVKQKKIAKILTEEENGNNNFNIFSPIDEKYSRNFGENEFNEMKNYLFNIGIKYDINKNNLFIKKLGIKSTNLEINDIMGDEIELLFKKAITEGKDIKDEDDEEDNKKSGKIKYHPSKEEEEIIEIGNWKDNNIP